ncbi:MAG TPA: glutamyl-tRNA reductase [Longimicrobiales bacterium]|nr:glutamyl-tRNA reductase [Longimicrobiales bacterium]
MELFVVGTSHAVAPPEARARLHVALADVYETAARLRDRGLAEAVALSTCGRLELYGAAQPGGAADTLLSLLARRSGLPPDEVRACTYVRREGEAVRHLLRVASGLDSVVLGEAEILGQVRAAARHPLAGVTRGPLLHRLFQQAVTAGKRVRSETGLARGAASLAGASLALLRAEAGSLDPLTVLVVGAGQSGALMTKLLAKAGAGRLIVLNRTLERARRVAARTGAEARGLDALAASLAEADVVASCVSTGSWVVDAGMLEAAPPRRRWLLDLAHPRSLDPALASVDGTRVFDLEDVYRQVRSGVRARAAAVPAAEAVVEEEALAFERWRRAREAAAARRTARREGHAGSALLFGLDTAGGGAPSPA